MVAVWLSVFNDSTCSSMIHRSGCSQNVSNWHHFSSRIREINPLLRLRAPTSKAPFSDREAAVGQQTTFTRASNSTQLHYWRVLKEDMMNWTSPNCIKSPDVSHVTWPAVCIYLIRTGMTHRDAQLQPRTVSELGSFMKKDRSLGSEVAWILALPQHADGLLSAPWSPLESKWRDLTFRILPRTPPQCRLRKGGLRKTEWQTRA